MALFLQAEHTSMLGRRSRSGEGTYGHSDLSLSLPPSLLSLSLSHSLTHSLSHSLSRSLSLSPSLSRPLYREEALVALAVVRLARLLN